MKQTKAGKPVKALKLQVGKTYETRSGRQCLITSKSRRGKWPYNGRWLSQEMKFAECSFEQNGQWSMEIAVDRDLVREVPAVKPSPPSPRKTTFHKQK